MMVYTLLVLRIMSMWIVFQLFQILAMMKSLKGNSFNTEYTTLQMKIELI